MIKIEDDDFLDEDFSEEEEIDKALDDEEIDAGEAGFLKGYFGEEED